MGTQIKDLNEETAPDSGDRFLVQKASDNKYVSVTGANILPADSINIERLSNRDNTLTVTDTTTDRVWWRELKRSTLTSSADTITATLDVDQAKYLKVLVYLIPTGGTINQTMRFNLAGGTAYAGRASDNGGADSTAVSQSSFNLSTGTAATPQFDVIDVWFQTGVQTLITARVVGQSTAGATTAPLRKEYTGKYVSTSIPGVIEIINSAGTGSYATGSTVVVLGHD